VITAPPVSVTGSPADATAAPATLANTTGPAPVEPPAPAATALPPAAPAPAPAPIGIVTLGPKGFNAQTEDGRFAFNIRFPFMFDAKATISEELPLNGDAFYPRFFGPIISGTLFKNVTGRLIVGFQDRSVTVVNAWMDLAVTSWLHLRVGKVLSPLSLERATLPLRITLLEHGLASSLLPISEFGVSLWGASDDKLIEYTAMLSNGAAANIHYEVDQDPGKDILGRVFVKPFVRTGIPGLAGFGLGIGASYGVHKGSAANPLTGNARTLGGRVFFSTIANAMEPEATVFADGKVIRIVPQAAYVAGPLALYGEYLRTTERLRAGNRTADITNSSYHAVAAVVLTGENAVLLDVLSPKRPFNWDEGHYGAFELVARAEHIDYDKDLFPRFANPVAAAKSATAFGGGFNWIPTDAVRLMVNYEYTQFTAAQGATKLRHEHLLGLRLQALF
jgi:phosphate-selective porin OprO/OprP